MHGYGPWGAGNIVMMILAFVFLLLLLVGIVLIVLWAVRQHRGPGEETEIPLEILKKRYARGEISREDYERMKQELS